MDELEALRRKNERIKKEVEQLERALETRTREVYLANEEHRRARTNLESVLQTMRGALLVLNKDGTVETANRAAAQLLQNEESNLRGTSIDTFIRFNGEPLSLEQLNCVLGQSDVEMEFVAATGKVHPVLFGANSREDGSIVCSAQDISNRRQLEAELLHARKLEALGQMVSGVAHELNTPVQYVADNHRFLESSIDGIRQAMQAYQAWAEDPNAPEAKVKLNELLEELDLEFLWEEIEPCLSQSLDGLNQIASIVRSMKEFSHPSDGNKKPTDINRVVETALAMGKSEWKYVANVETHLDPTLPSVHGLQDQLGQVVLNLVVNAAHALQDAKQAQAGKIEIASFAEADHVVLTIRDNGPGIAKEHIERIFDPFFTTKEVGKGTGQGLAISHSIVVSGHGGQLDVESEPGNGALFRIRLPQAA